MNYSLKVKKKDQKPLASYDVFIQFTFFSGSQHLLHHDFNIHYAVNKQIIISFKFCFRTLSNYFINE